MHRCLPIIFALTLQAQPTNFVLVYLDDLRWTDTSVEMIKGRADTRSDFYQTPHLERLAREGMVFSAAYSPAPACPPSRNNMLHGMTPARVEKYIVWLKEQIVFTWKRTALHE